MKNDTKFTFGLIAMVQFVFIGVLVLISVVCWDYTISNILLHYNKPDNFTMFHGFLLSLIPGLGQLSIPAAILTYIVLSII